MQHAKSKDRPETRRCGCTRGRIDKDAWTHASSPTCQRECSLRRHSLRSSPRTGSGPVAEMGPGMQPVSPSPPSSPAGFDHPRTPQNRGQSSGRASALAHGVPPCRRGGSAPRRGSRDGANWRSQRRVPLLAALARVRGSCLGPSTAESPRDRTQLAGHLRGPPQISKRWRVDSGERGLLGCGDLSLVSHSVATNSEGGRL